MKNVLFWALCLPVSLFAQLRVVENFGQSGQIPLGSASDKHSFTTLAAGGFVVATQSEGAIYLRKFEENGKPSANFQLESAKLPAPSANGEREFTLEKVAEMPNGNLAVANTLSMPFRLPNGLGDTRYYTQLNVFLPNGKPDISFGNQGKISLDLEFTYGCILNDIFIQSDGKILITATSKKVIREASISYSIEEVYLIRIGSKGGFDKSFGKNGVLATHCPTIAKASVSMLPDSSIWLCGPTTFKHHPSRKQDQQFEEYVTGYVVKYDINGVPDGTLGQKGRMSHPVSFPSAPMLVTPDKGVIFTGSQSQVHVSASRDVGKLNNNGTIDGSFGNYGLASVNADNYDPNESVEVASTMLEEGKFLVSHSGKQKESEKFDTRFYFFLPDGAYDESVAAEGKVALENIDLIKQIFYQEKKIFAIASKGENAFLTCREVY